MPYLSETDVARLIATKGDLTDIDLSDADTDLQALNFAGCKGVIDAGFDDRGYRFLGIKQGDSWKIKAGCRWFDVEEAYDHWGGKGNHDATRRVGLIVAASISPSTPPIATEPTPIAKGRDLTDIETWVEDKMNLAGGDFSGDKDHLSGKSLGGGLFAGSDFSHSDLSESTLLGCDFTGAKFINADLSGCDLARANFTDADLTGVNLRDAQIERAIFSGCVGLIDAGMDPRGYRFVGVIRDGALWRIKAGCRWYRPEHAIEHWRDDMKNVDAMDRVQTIIDGAKS